MIKDSSETSRFPNFFIFLDILRRARVRRFCRMREQAPRAFGAAPRRWASCCRFSRTCNKPPTPSALPPKFGGLLGEDLGVEVRVGTLMKLTADLEAPWRKTPTPNKSPVSPHSGGQRRRRGGHVTRSAKLSLHAKLHPHARNVERLCYTNKGGVKFKRPLVTIRANEKGQRFHARTFEQRA